MTNYEVVEKWLDYPDRECHAKGGNLFAQNEILYSYGLHHPLAVRPNGVTVRRKNGRGGYLYVREYPSQVVINGDNVSITTLKHLSILQRVLRMEKNAYIDAITISFSALGSMIFSRPSPFNHYRGANKKRKRRDVNQARRWRRGYATNDGNEVARMFSTGDIKILDTMPPHWKNFTQDETYATNPERRNGEAEVRRVRPEVLRELTPGFTLFYTETKSGVRISAHWPDVVLMRAPDVKGGGEQTVLMGIDGENYFCSRLPKKVDSLKEAFASLKPEPVKFYEGYSGREPLRQGEWFFVPMRAKGDKKLTDIFLHVANWSQIFLGKTEAASRKMVADAVKQILTAPLPSKDKNSNHHEVPHVVLRGELPFQEREIIICRGSVNHSQHRRLSLETGGFPKGSLFLAFRNESLWDTSSAASGGVD